MAQPSTEEQTLDRTDPAAPGTETGKAMLEELQASGFVGMWKDRQDIGDSSAFARRLREGLETRADRFDQDGAAVECGESPEHDLSD